MASSGNNRGGPVTARFDAIGMVVADMAATLAFYRLLGIDIADGVEGEGHVEATLPGGTRLMWDTIEVVRSFSEWQPATGGHRMSLAFRCKEPAEVDTIYRRLAAAGHDGPVAPFDSFWGQRYATVLDPDGNPVDLFAPLPS
jgi:uncharacterized glyoxalase superfamily protein PhnB